MLDREVVELAKYLPPWLPHVLPLVMAAGKSLQNALYTAVCAFIGTGVGYVFFQKKERRELVKYLRRLFGGRSDGFYERLGLAVFMFSGLFVTLCAYGAADPGRALVCGASWYPLVRMVRDRIEGNGRATLEGNTS